MRFTNIKKWGDIFSDKKRWSTEPHADVSISSPKALVTSRSVATEAPRPSGFISTTGLIPLFIPSNLIYPGLSLWRRRFHQTKPIWIDSQTTSAGWSSWIPPPLDQKKKRTPQFCYLKIMRYLSRGSWENNVWYLEITIVIRLLSRRRRTRALQTEPLSRDNEIVRTRSCENKPIPPDNHTIKFFISTKRGKGDKNSRSWISRVKKEIRKSRSGRINNNLEEQREGEV